MKDGGIGLPPLFHLIQKSIQTVFPFYHFTLVRLANYIFGSIFVIMLVRYLIKEPHASGQKQPKQFFLITASISAFVVDTFVFSQTGGLLCLFSLWLLITGESFIHRPSAQRLFIFIGVTAAGFLVDYRFVFLLPYMVLVLCSVLRWTRFLYYLMFTALIGIWLAAYYWAGQQAGQTLQQTGYGLWTDMALIINAAIHVILPFVPQEIFYLALFIFGFAVIYSLRRVSGMARDDVGRQGHIVFGVIGALIMILLANVFVYRNLLESRSVIILFPFIFCYCCSKFDRLALNVLSWLFLASALLYMPSYWLHDGFPPSVAPRNQPVIFYDVASFSNQYLHAPENKKPMIYDGEAFGYDCRVCRMGADDIDIRKYGHVWVVSPVFAGHGRFIPSNFIPSQREVHLTGLDKFLTKYLTFPKHTKYTLSEYKRFEKK